MSYSFERYVEDVQFELPQLGAKKAVLYGDLKPIGLIKMVAIELFSSDDQMKQQSSLAYKTRELLRQVNNSEPIDWGY